MIKKLFKIKQFSFVKLIINILVIISISIIFGSSTSQANTDATVSKAQTAIFAAGCFWCVEHDFAQVNGVLNVVSGYAGGQIPDPSYQQVSSGQTQYAEAVKITYDPAVVSYQNLLNKFWHSTDPTVENRQFCDIGHQYRSEIFYENDEQKRLALASLAEIKQQFPKVYTKVSAATTFYPAEDYHQDYAKKNPIRYHFYRWNCGRDKRLKDIWGDI